MPFRTLSRAGSLHRLGLSWWVSVGLVPDCLGGAFLVNSSCQPSEADKISIICLGVKEAGEELLNNPFCKIRVFETISACSFLPPLWHEFPLTHMVLYFWIKGASCWFLTVSWTAAVHLRRMLLYSSSNTYFGIYIM